MSRADDHAAIHDLYARYCFAIDGNDGGAFADCFTADGVFAVSGRPPVEGRDALASFVADTASDRPRHMFKNLWITQLEGGRAEAKAYFLLVDQSTGRNVAYGHYEDHMTDDGGVWRWTERQVIFDWMSDDFAARGRASVQAD